MSSRQPLAGLRGANVSVRGARFRPCLDTSPFLETGDRSAKILKPRVCYSRSRCRLHPCHHSRQALSSPRLPTSRMMMCARVHRLLLSMGAQLPRSAPRGRERPWCSMKNSMSLLPRAARRAGLRVCSWHRHWWDLDRARTRRSALSRQFRALCSMCSVMGSKI